MRKTKNALCNLLKMRFFNRLQTAVVGGCACRIASVEKYTYFSFQPPFRRLKLGAAAPKTPIQKGMINMPMRKGNKEKKVYFSPEEWRIVCDRAAALGQRTGTYIRNIAVRGMIKSFDVKQFNNLIVSFNRIGNELNQIAMVANSTGSIYQKDIEDMRETYKYLKTVFTDYLSEIKSVEILKGG